MEPDGSMSGIWETEEVLFCSDPGLGLRAVIAIDDTSRGPGLGGIRLKAYSTDSEGVRECRRLAAAMTLKNAFAELPFGGAKAVIFDSGGFDDRAAAMRRFGEFVASAGGGYLPGVDMGTTVEDLAMVERGGAVVSCSTVDPSSWTARGVHAAIAAAVRHTDRSNGLEGTTVVVQGAGHVGGPLAESLAREGARVLISDLDADRARGVAERVGGMAIEPSAALITPCDVLAPCAAAGVINPGVVPGLRCRIIAGAANDTLAGAGTDRALAERAITYVPDFVANAGGVIQIQAERRAWSDELLGHEVDRIGDRVAGVLAEADTGGETPLGVAVRRARELVSITPSGLGAAV